MEVRKYKEAYNCVTERIANHYRADSMGMLYDGTYRVYKIKRSCSVNRCNLSNINNRSEEPLHAINEDNKK
jgi:hypothetical protein